MLHAAQYVLMGGANVSRWFRLPDGRTVTPLTYAAMCAALMNNSTENTVGDSRFRFQLLLAAGAVQNAGAAHIRYRCRPSAQCSRVEVCMRIAVLLE